MTDEQYKELLDAVRSIQKAIDQQRLRFFTVTENIADGIARYGSYLADSGVRYNNILTTVESIQEETEHIAAMLGTSINTKLKDPCADSAVGESDIHEGEDDEPIIFRGRCDEIELKDRPNSTNGIRIQPLEDSEWFDEVYIEVPDSVFDDMLPYLRFEGCKCIEIRHIDEIPGYIYAKDWDNYDIRVVDLDGGYHKLVSK